MSNQKIVTEAALSAIASDIKNALSGKANSNDVYPKSQTYNRTEIDNALNLKADKSELYNVYPTEQESGAIAHFTDGADNIPVKALVSQIVATGGGGTPDAPIAINGFDSGVITRCGVNFWNEQWELGLYSSATGEPVSSSSYIRSKSTNFIRVAPNITIYAKSPKTLRLLFYDKSYQFVSFIDALNQNVTIPNNVYYVRFSVYDNSYGTTYNNDISINYPSSDTDYHAYNGNTYTFAFGQTVYGGHFDNKGNLVVTHGCVDLGDLAWSNFAGGSLKMIYMQFPDCPKPINNLTRASLICSNMPTKSRSEIRYSEPYNDGIGIDASGNLFVAYPSGSWTDLANAKSGLSGWYMCYELATPITLSITSQDIPTLLGENNIFSNTGDVEVDYHADIGLYIDKKVSSLAQG